MRAPSRAFELLPSAKPNPAAFCHHPSCNWDPLWGAQVGPIAGSIWGKGAGYTAVGGWGGGSALLALHKQVSAPHCSSHAGTTAHAPQTPRAQQASSRRPLGTEMHRPTQTAAAAAQQTRQRWLRLQPHLKQVRAALLPPGVSAEKCMHCTADIPPRHLRTSTCTRLLTPLEGCQHCSASIFPQTRW